MDSNALMNALGPGLLAAPGQGATIHLLAMAITTAAVLISLFWAEGLEDLPRMLVWGGLFLIPFWAIVSMALLPKLVRADRPRTAIGMGAVCIFAAGFQGLLFAALLRLS